MPPKKAAPAQPSKKADQKKKEKVIEVSAQWTDNLFKLYVAIQDKTFGLKNKKGSKQQKFIQQVQHQVKQGGPKKVGRPDLITTIVFKIVFQAELAPNAPTKKDDKKKQLEELNNLFRPVTTQKVEKGVDPKSVLCAFFKSGQCGKGDKCKFSHDVALERKSEKKNVYFDVRQEETMEDWDEEKLKEVVAKKHGERDGKMPTTTIICKHFLEGNCVL